MHSFDSMHSKQSIARVRPRPLAQTTVPTENVWPVANNPTETYNHTHSLRRYHIAPHTLGLGLASTCDGFPANDHPFMFSEDISSTATDARPATAMNFREKLDRSRFEFKAVRRRASGDIRGRGKQLIERVRQKDSDGAMGGWI
jgi:hypothetical protein